MADEEDMRTRSEIKKFFRRTKKYLIKRFPALAEIRNPWKELWKKKESTSVSVTTYNQDTSSGKEKKMKMSKTVKVRSKDYVPDGTDIAKTAETEPPIQEVPSERVPEPAPIPSSAPAASASAAPAQAPEPTTPVSRKMQPSSSKSTSSESSFVGGLLSRKGTGRNLKEATSTKATPVLAPQAEIPFNYSGDPDELVENPGSLDGPDEVTAARRKARREKSANFWIDRTAQDTDEMKIQDIPSTDLYGEDSHRRNPGLAAVTEVSERESMTEKRDKLDEY